MTFADGLTILRIVLVPFFLVSFLKGEFKLAFLFFTVAGVTDLIDGSIARWLKHPTELGAFLDPIADKALMVTTVTCLLLAQIIPFWFFLLVVARDFAILGGLVFLKIKKIPFELKPVLTSKVGTLSNILLVICGFLSFLYPTLYFLRQPFSFWFEIFLWLSTTLVVISSGQYCYTGLKILGHPARHG